MSALGSLWNPDLTSATGSFGRKIPRGTGGLTVRIQAFVIDAGAPDGFAATSGYQLDVAPGG